MVFSSLTFVFLFLPTVLLLYPLMPKKIKNLFLFSVSLFYYFLGGGGGINIVYFF